MAATAITFSVGAATAAPASAVDNVKPFGSQERLNGANGAPMIGYTVRDLSPSSDPVPHNGQLYEATVTVDAFGSWATPIVPMFNARAESSAMYRVVADAGVGGAVLPGGSTTGKLYFDVVGDVPNSVVYNDGVRDILAWVPGDPQGVHAPSGSGTAAPAASSNRNDAHRCGSIVVARLSTCTLTIRYHSRLNPGASWAVGGCGVAT